MKSELLTFGELRARYGAFVESRREFSIEDVPPSLRGLAPYAEIWAAGDDTVRERLVDSAPALAQADLLAIFDDPDRLGALSDWLATEGLRSDAYFAFTDLELAYESLAAMRSWREANGSTK